jgi:ubiquinone/menaquinone biosynthesis C-methylase UbiE
MEFCNSSDLNPEILECGAGVWDAVAEPLFVRFYEHGYQVHGIEISEERAEAALAYCQANKVEADIRVGDMRQLPFEDQSMSFIFSYNSIFHMAKTDVAVAMREIERVLKPQGLCFVNFLSVASDSYGTGKEIGKGEFLEQEAGEQVVHGYYEDSEADPYFGGFEVLHKEKRVRERLSGGERWVRAYIDYIASKQ